MMLAQGATMADSTLASWIQLIVQCGALGLMAIICYYGPAWIERILDKQAAERTAILASNRSDNKESRDAFEKRNDQVVGAIIAQTVALERKFDLQTERLEKQLVKLDASVLKSCKAPDCWDGHTERRGEGS